MVDQSFWFPDGIAKDVMVNISDHYVPTDFMVLDMGDEDGVHLILGRPFLNTTRAAIYIRIGEVHFQFQSEKVRCYFNSYTTHEVHRKNRPRRRRGQRQKKQATKDGWTDYPGEVSRYEDRFNDEDKSSSEKEAVPPASEEAAPSTENVPVTTESKEKEEPQEESLIKKVWKKTTLEEVVKDKSLSPKSKSTLPGKEVWKIKGSLSSSPKEEVQSGSPSRPSDIPWDV